MKVSEFVEEKFAKFEAQQKKSGGVMLTPSYVLQLQQQSKSDQSSSNCSNKTHGNHTTRDNSQEKEDENNSLEDSEWNEDQKQRQYLLPQRVIMLLLILHDLSEILYLVFRWFKAMLWDNACYYLDIIYTSILPEHWREMIATYANIQSLDAAYYSYMGSKASAPPPALAALAVCTIFALLVHPDGYTWVVVGEIIDRIREVFRFVRTTLTCIRQGKMPSFFVSEAFAGAIVLLLLCLYIHYIATSESDSPITRQRTKKEKSGKRGKHKGRQRHGHSINNGNKSKNRNNQNALQFQQTFRTTLEKEVTEPLVEDCDDVRSCSESVATCPDSTNVNDNVRSSSSSSNMLQTEICPGRRKSFDSIDIASDVSMYSTNNAGTDEVLNMPVVTSNLSMSEETTTNQHHEQHKQVSKNRQVRAMSEDNYFQRKTQLSTKASRKMKKNPNGHDKPSLKTSDAFNHLPRAQEDTVSSKRIQDSSRVFSNMNSRKRTIQRKYIIGSNEILPSNNEVTPPVSSAMNSSKQISQDRSNINRQGKVLQLSNDHNMMIPPINLTLTKQHDKLSFNKVNEIRYPVPYFANSMSTDGRYTPGKLDLASFLAQAGLVGTECAQLLTDLANVDALRSFSDADFTKYQVDFEKKNRIIMLLEARRRAEMNRALNYHQVHGENFQSNESSRHRPLFPDMQYQQDSRWKLNNSPIRPPPGLDGFISREDKPLDESDKLTSFSQVIGVPHATTSLEETHHLSPRKEMYTSENTEVVSPRSMEDGYQFHPRNVTRNHQQQQRQHLEAQAPLLFGCSSESAQQVNDEDMMIEAEMSALGDQMADSILDF